MELLVIAFLWVACGVEAAVLYRDFERRFRNRDPGFDWLVFILGPGTLVGVAFDFREELRRPDPFYQLLREQRAMQPNHPIWE